MKRPLVIAHRGASSDAPENTIAAFELALEQGADALEMDIHLSKDGHPVVIHDFTLERTTDGVGPVSERTVRRGLALLDYVCRRPTWTVRHKAAEQPDYLPKRRGSRRS